MDFQKLSAWALRLGLALTYLYSGTHLISDPGPWLGYLPEWFKNLLPLAPELYLQLQGGVELFLAASFLTGAGIQWAALVSSAEIAGILLFYGVDLISFRDLAVLGAAISLFLSYSDETSR